MQRSDLSRALLLYHLPSIGVLVVGLLLSIFVFQARRDSENGVARQDFKHAAATHATAIKREIDHHEEILNSVGALYDASLGVVSRAQFHIFTMQLLLPESPAVQAVEWVPRVPGVRRAEYEASARKAFPAFRISERSSQGSLVRAGARDTYFPVYYVEPYAGNEPALGFDLASDPARREALMRAATTGRLAATAPIRLVQEKGNQSGVLVFIPVYRGGAHPAAPRIDDLLGLASGVFRIGDVVEQALRSQPAAGVDIALYDDAAAPEARRLYFHNSRALASATGPTSVPGDKSADALRYATAFEIGGRVWTIVITPAPGQYSLAASDRAWVRLLTGVAFTLALVALLQIARYRTEKLAAALRENEKITHSLRESEAKFRGLVNQSLVGITIIEDGKFSYSNARFNEIFGYSADEIRSLGPLDIVIDSDRLRVAENIRKRLSGEVDRTDYLFRGVRKNGAVIDVEVHGSAMEIGSTLALISLVLDVSERTQAEREVQALQERLREQTTHDPLTGLYNRRYLEETLRRELILADRIGRPVSVIMGDLDNFKAVNDRHGHLAGDEVLRVFGGLMTQYARGSDIFCRYGGEEFLLVMPGMKEEDAVERAEQLRSAMATALIPYGASSLAVTASFGVATFPRDGRNGNELIAAADAALYAAKAAGRNRISVSTGPAMR